jgi:UDP-N-acetylglucosamine/UDP-N-acetylgalactosamine diphosphorylase
MTEYTKKGLDCIRHGRAGVLILAGCMATSLGSAEQSMGTFNIGLPSQKSIFQLLVERFIKAQMLAHGTDSKEMTPLNCKLYIMTSSTNQHEIIEFFSRHNYFGANKEQIVFFESADIPILSHDGNIVLEHRDSMTMNSVGNGAALDAIHRCEKLRDSLRENVDYL